MSGGTLKVYGFRGGPLDGQQHAVAPKHGSAFPAHVFECRVQEPLTLAASWEAYQEANPVSVKAPPIHRYFYSLEHDAYRYLGAT